MQTTHDHSAAEKATCPRCGYDQRGPMTTWTESCPLHGTCSECGLVFNWAEVILPEKFEPRWCVEFVPRWVHVPRACVSTAMQSFQPWRFWTRLKMSQQVRPLRLAAYVLILLGSLSILYTPVQISAAVFMRSIMLHQMTGYRGTWVAQIPHLKQALVPGSMDIMFPSMSDEEKDALRLQYQRQITFAQQLALAPPPQISSSILMLIVEALFTPLAQTSAATIDYGGGVMTAGYVAPINIWSSIRRLGYGNVDSGEFDMLLYGLTCNFILLLAFPATMVLLPASRERAKVRWSHIGRITIYSLYILWMSIFAVGVTFIVPTLWTDTLWQTIASNAHFAVWIALPLWWMAAIRRYLRMPHAEAIVIAMMVIILILMILILEPILPAPFTKWLLG